MKIVLDAIEEKVRNLLLQYSKEFAKNGYPEVTLRFTGGWVRDKLLGKRSHDIDVAIDKTTGEEFATGLHNYMVDIGIDETGVHKIAVNPDKSKHLETATTRVCGLDVDFVNLRCEEYANADSRVPSSIRFGTPEEDAFRRDATLNALFYNLSTREIEDFTKRGLTDLENGVLRTPLDPLETFNDDPLRVLRLLRFMGQLGFTIAPETQQAMQGNVIGNKLITKVSSERMGAELLKLVESPHAIDGLRCFIDLGLGPYVFKVPGQDVHAETSVLQLRFDSLLRAKTAASTIMPSSPTSWGMLWFSTLLQDLHDGDRKHNYVSEIVQNGLKLTRNAKEGCVKLVTSASAFDELRKLWLSGQWKRSDLGNFVRAFGSAWDLCLAFNAARLQFAKESVDDAVQIHDRIMELYLSNAYDLKPMLAGKEIMALTQRKPGSWLQPLLKQEVDFQLDHPEASKEEVQQFVLKLLE